MLCPNNYLGLRVISIFDYCKSNNVNLLISYSNKGLVSVDRLHEIAQAYFKNVSLTNIDYSHSTQGKVSNKIQEILLSCSN